MNPFAAAEIAEHPAVAQAPASLADAQPMLVRSAAVLGAGTMGSRIAAHLANCGIPVLLLDIFPGGQPKSPQPAGHCGHRNPAQSQTRRLRRTRSRAPHHPRQF
jgi:hypothetical protein